MNAMIVSPRVDFVATVANKNDGFLVDDPVRF